MNIRCSRCKEVKNRDDFFKRGKNSRQSICKKCILDAQKKRWKARKIKAVNLLGGKCSICGYHRNYASLEFHHVDPSSKKGNWKRICKKEWYSIISELKKCILLCRNCHSELHNPDLSCEEYKEEYIELLATYKAVCLDMKVGSTGCCPICNKEVYSTIYCSNKCRAVDTRRVKRPEKLELKKMIENMSWLAIGRKFGVSDNAVRKWARSYEII